MIVIVGNVIDNNLTTSATKRNYPIAAIPNLDVPHVASQFARSVGMRDTTNTKSFELLFFLI